MCFCVGKCSVGVSGESRVESLDMSLRTQLAAPSDSPCVVGNWIMCFRLPSSMGRDLGAPL